MEWVVILLAAVFGALLVVALLLLSSQGYLVKIGFLLEAIQSEISNRSGDLAKGLHEIRNELHEFNRHDPLDKLGDISDNLLAVEREIESMGKLLEMKLEDIRGEIEELQFRSPSS